MHRGNNAKNNAAIPNKELRIIPSNIQLSDRIEKNKGSLAVISIELTSLIDPIALNANGVRNLNILNFDSLDLK